MKNGGLVLWSAIAICEMFKTSWHGEKHHMRDDLENHSKDRLFRSNGLNMFRFLHETSQGSTRQSLTRNLRICTGCREESGKVTFWQTLRSWEHWTRHKSTLEVSTLRKRQRSNFSFSVADGTAKLRGRDHEIRESTLRQY